MYCQFCGKNHPDDSKFCPFCGGAINVQKAVSKDKNSFLYYIFGVLFILGGLLPYLLPEAPFDTSAYPFSTDLFSAISGFSSFLDNCSQLFYFPSSMFAVYTGLLLLKKESNLNVPIIACSVVHIVSFLYSGTIKLLLYCFPKFVLSLYTSKTSVITAGEYLIKSEPFLLYSYQDNAARRLIISVVLVALSVAFLFIKKRHMNSTPPNAAKTSFVGSLAMILSITFLSEFGPSVSNLLIKPYGNLQTTALGLANVSIYANFEFIIPLVFMIIIGVAVLFTRTKRWILAIPTVSIVAILGFFASLSSNWLVRNWMEIPADLLPLTSKYFSGIILSSALILIAMFYWFGSVSRNKIPMWLQIALPVSLPLIYTLGEIIGIVVLQADFGITLGLASVAFLTIILSLLVRTKTTK